MDWEEFYNPPHLDSLAARTSFSKTGLQEFAFVIEFRSHKANELFECNKNKSCIQVKFTDTDISACLSEEDNSQRATPAVDAVDNEPSAWVCPLWNADKSWWTF